MTTVYAFFSKAASDPLLANRLKALDTVEAVVQLGSRVRFYRGTVRACASSSFPRSSDGT
ncbi:Nif11-like leader peptide family natural product precursor [Paenibacillus allorhizosphaerae]|uniref:Nif11-like leader peptide family natural product precursor n=1 Tax=Paenibacillus allorhizosphaerae TaxID=2849866 RepID=UPI001C4070E3|nr:Nif11-like leader peptide family natural product precursor [Paenibacillus allorhizosphaerae]